MWHSLEKEVRPGQWMSCENIILLETKLSQRADHCKWMQDLKESSSFIAAWNGECQVESRGMRNGCLMDTHKMRCFGWMAVMATQC